MNFLKLIIGGRLTRDPEVKTAKSGKSYVRFGLACATGFGEYKKSRFFNVTMFGKRGEAVAQYLKKGDPILVECEDIESSAWTATNGEAKSSVDIIASSFNFVGSASNDSKETAEKETRPF